MIFRHVPSLCETLTMKTLRRLFFQTYVCFYTRTTSTWASGIGSHILTILSVLWSSSTTVGLLVTHLFSFVMTHPQATFWHMNRRLEATSQINVPPSIFLCLSNSGSHGVAIGYHLQYADSTQKDQGWIQTQACCEFMVPSLCPAVCICFLRVVSNQHFQSSKILAACCSTLMTPCVSWMLIGWQGAKTMKLATAEFTRNEGSSYKKKIKDLKFVCLRLFFDLSTQTKCLS